MGAVLELAHCSGHGVSDSGNQPHPAVVKNMDLVRAYPDLKSKPARRLFFFFIFSFQLNGGAAELATVRLDSGNERLVFLECPSSALPDVIPPVIVRNDAMCNILKVSGPLGPQIQGRVFCI